MGLQTNEIDNMEESDLKALLEEAITYKRPKDREHKSATFNELLSKTEMEDQEQNFPFTSRAVQTKRASGRPTQGGSLQDLPEASLQDYYYSEFSFATDYYSNRGGGFQQNFRRHHNSSSASSSGPGGGDRATNPRQKRTTSSVSSRQREGGSLPSNVNVECPFFNDVGHHHTTGTITKFKKREGGSKSDYGTMVLTAPLMTSAGAAELISAVAEVAGSTGLCGGMKNTESPLPPVVVPATTTIPNAQAVTTMPPAGPPPVAMNSTSTSSSNTSALGCNNSTGINSSSSSNIHTSLNNQTVASCSGSSSSINSCSSASLQQEAKPKIKEINLRFIAPEPLLTNHNHDKIVHFVGMAWEDAICGSAQYYEEQ